MASSSFSSQSHPIIFGISIFIFLSLFFSPSHSAVTCATQKFSSNRSYANCTDLPALGATLHFTYNATNGSIAVAFTATPPKSDGWVAWGINPTSPQMVGTQALIAYKSNGNAVTVHTYNLTSYKAIDEVKKLSFDTWDVSAEESNGVITIFAVAKVPEKAENLSQVWQVGPTSGGKPGVHEFKDQNLKAKTALQVVGSTSNSNGTSSGGNSSSGGDTSGHKNGGVSLVGERFGFGFYCGFVFLLFSLLTM